MFISQISIFVENKQGSLAAVTAILAAEGIDIRAFSIADTTDFGILRMIVDNPELAEKVLRRNNIAVSITKVIAVQIEDRPGAMHRIMQLLADDRISVEYAYAFISRRKENAYVILRVEDNDRAAALFAAHSIPTLQPHEVYTI